MIAYIAQDYNGKIYNGCSSRIKGNELDGQKLYAVTLNAYVTKDNVEDIINFLRITAKALVKNPAANTTT